MSEETDPLVFAARALESEGALVERGASSALAILAPSLASGLGTPETLTLSADAAAGETPIGFGSALLERLLARVRQSVPIAPLRLELDAPRASSVRSLAERVVIRNGVAEAHEVRTAERDYVMLWMAWTAASDDRDEGLVVACACTVDASTPAPAWVASLAPDAQLSMFATALHDPMRAGAISERLVARAAADARRAVAPALARSERRYARDHARLADYYAALAHDASSRRRTDEGARRALIEHLRADRDAKLRELDDRYAVRLTLTPVAGLLVRANATEIALRVRRRKGERTVLVRAPAGSAALDRLACDACLAGTTLAPVLCDDRLHALCEACAPGAEGRPRCQACHRGRT